MNQVIYPHVPRTCGTALKNRISAAYRMVFGPNTTANNMDWHIVLNATTAELGLRKFIAGHFGYCIKSLLPTSPTMVTMLRNPVQRTISYTKFVHRTGAHYHHNSIRGMTVKEVLRDRATVEILRNSQARYLAMDMNMRDFAGNLTAPKTPENIHRAFETWQQPYSEDKLFEVAAQRLKDEFVFGIAERHWDSTDLILSTIGLPPVEKTPPHPMPEHTHGLDEADLMVAREICSVDIALYKFACGLFNERMREYENRVDNDCV